MTFRATVLTIFPDMFPGPLGLSLAGKALAAGAWALETVDIRDFGLGAHRQVDDTPAGGGPGEMGDEQVTAAFGTGQVGVAHPEYVDAAPGELLGRFLQSSGVEKHGASQDRLDPYDKRRRSRTQGSPVTKARIRQTAATAARLPSAA